MRWLIRLYPPAWRRRYGRELAELLAAQPPSFSIGIDVIAGAVDAWLNPQSSTTVTTADAKGAAVLPKMLHLRNGGHGPNVTRADHLKAGAVTIGGTLALVVPITVAIVRYGKNPYLDSFLATGWLVPWLFSQHYTTYKGRPARVQAVLIGAPAMFVIAVALAAGSFAGWLRALNSH